MIKFDTEKVKLLHQLIAEETGGGIGIRDESLLDSALAQIYQTFDGYELYPSKEEKAARLAFSLISNHAFLDGNKRIGILVMISFLEVNGIKLSVTDKELITLGTNIASGKFTYDDLLNFIMSHK